jgi:2-dehydro-3-deoxygalactonokinase
MMPTQFLSCDWGTSSFRLRLVLWDRLKVLREVRTEDGVRGIFERGGDRERCFAEFLFGKLMEVKAEVGTPLIISGMASSSIGWKELPYAQAPFLVFEDLVVEKLAWEKPAWLGETFLVSGVATRFEILRGEETQAYGILAEPAMGRFREACHLVLPGTHSKHLLIRHGKIAGIQTFMTGEVFEVVSRHTLLKATLDLAAPPDFGAFREGVEKASEPDADLLNALFQVRTRCVLRKEPVAGNASYLSGLLIGSELARLARGATAPILIAPTAALSAYYSEAMKILAPAELEWSCLSAEALDQATIRAHALLLEKHLA